MATTVIINPNNVKPKGNTCQGIQVGSNVVKRVQIGTNILYDRKVYSLSKLKSSYSIGVNGGSFDLSTYISSIYENFDGTTNVGYTYTPTSIGSNSGNTSSRSGNITVTQNTSSLSETLPYTQAADAITSSTVNVTSITITLNSVGTIPASGGTISSCGYVVTAYGYYINHWKSGGTTRGSSTSFDCSSSASVYWTGVTASSRGTVSGASRTAGTLYADAYYSGCSASASITVYQAANTQSGPYWTSLTLSLGIPATIPASGGTVGSCNYSCTASGYYSYSSGDRADTSTSVTPTMSWTSVTASSRGTVSGASRTAGTLYGQGTWNGLTSNKASASVLQDANYQYGPYISALVITKTSEPSDIPASGGTVSSFGVSGAFSRYYSYSSNETASTTSQSCSPSYSWSEGIYHGSLYDEVTTQKTYRGDLTVTGSLSGYTSNMLSAGVYQAINSVVTATTTTSAWTEDYNSEIIYTGTTNEYYAPILTSASGTAVASATSVVIGVYAYHDATRVGYEHATWTACTAPITETVYTSKYTGTTVGTITRTPQTEDTPYTGTTTQVYDDVTYNSKASWMTGFTANTSSRNATIGITQNSSTSSRTGSIVLSNSNATAKTATYRLTQSAMQMTNLYVLMRSGNPNSVWLSDSSSYISTRYAPAGIGVQNLTVEYEGQQYTGSFTFNAGDEYATVDYDGTIPDGAEAISGTLVWTGSQPTGYQLQTLNVI